MTHLGCALLAILGLALPAVGQAPSAGRCSGQLLQGTPGPWGALEYYHFFLEPSAKTLGSATLPAARVQWVFPDGTPREVAALLDKSDLQPEQRRRLQALIRPRPGGGCAVEPPADLVASLSSTARGQIYRVLSRWPENEYQTVPLTIPEAELGCWFEQSGLDPAIEERIRALLYRQGKSWMFSDVALLVPQVRTRDQRDRLLRVLYRERTLVLRLRVSESTDLEALARYWTAGGKSRGSLSLLGSIARTPGVDTLDIVHLLPPLARRYLYAYPTSAEVVNDDLPDCHWTSFNFFNGLPDHRFLDRTLMGPTLTREYEPVARPYRFGDLLMFCHRDRPGLCEHSTIFIADDIVFTKNGKHWTEPWILMTLQDLRSRYAIVENLEIQGYRKR